MLKIGLEDNISPMVKYWLAQNPKFLQSLSKSLAWFISKDIKKLTNDSQLTGQWRPRTPIRVRKKLDKRGRAPNRWLGKMYRAIAYQYQGDNTSVIGWASRNAAWYGRVFEEGRDTRITPKVRRLYFAKGLSVSVKESVDNPARPIYAPAMAIIEPKIPAFVQSKVERYMAKGREGFSAPKRIYEVFK